MPNQILIAYSTTDGHTRTICDRLARVMAAIDRPASVVPIEQVDHLALESFGGIVIGASIRYGKHQPQVARFIERHLAVLQSRPSAFFTVNIVARKPNKNRPETNPYLLKFLRQIPWKPAMLEVFAGRLDYPRYGWLDRQMIRFIMLLTQGPTDPETVIEYTDWQRVDAFAHAFCALPDAPGS